ncbi:SIS domain-containing protein [Aureimonas sp. SA4125]|uniref:SIS domain-containing protein n=1 Tax=Aureimonas sp. SA4125 TaxID=2826993 RepID=UPI001CC4FDD7|nr:SIS domain-containing protein [Aureimonas sp. SA4125]
MTSMMAREIATQPELMLSIQPVLARICDGLQKPRGRVFVGGCGDSAFAPKALAAVFRQIGVPIVPCSAMDLTGYIDLEPADTVILSSISGSTRRSVEAARVAHSRGARVVAVTCNGDSTLGLAADELVVLPYTPLSRKTPHTLDYTVTLLALVEIARSYAALPQESTRAILATMPGVLACARSEAAAVVPVAKEFGKFFFLGAGPGLGTAEYGAAKFHEAGGLVAIAAETENFVHGMNFMLEPDDLLIAIGGSNLAERRGGEVLSAFASLVATNHMHVGNAGSGSWQDKFADVMAQTFFVQCLCLQVSTLLNLQLEEPRAGRPCGAVHLAAQTIAMAN